MTIQLPDRLDLHQEGEETTALTLVASEDAVHAAEDVVRRLWEALPPSDRESAQPVRDAVKVMCILYVSQPTGRQHWLTWSVRGLLEPRISQQAEKWWHTILSAAMPEEDDAEAGPEDGAKAALRRLRADGAAARAAGVEPREALRELRGRDFRVRDRPDREAKDSDIRTREFRRVVGL